MAGILAMLSLCASLGVSFVPPGGRLFNYITLALFLLSPILALVGVGLGMAAVVKKTGKKALGITGLALSGVMVFLPFCLFIMMFLIRPVSF